MYILISVNHKIEIEIKIEIPHYYRNIPKQSLKHPAGLYKTFFIMMSVCQSVKM